MVRGGRLALYGAVSTVLAVWTVLNAFRQRSNFYAAAVYLSKSNACMMVRPLPLSPHDPTRRVLTLHARQILWNQGIFQTVMLGKLLQAVFLGELRLIEVEVRIDSKACERVVPELTWTCRCSGYKNEAGLPSPRPSSPSPSSRTTSRAPLSSSSSACYSSRCSTGSPATA